MNSNEAAARRILMTAKKFREEQEAGGYQITYSDYQRFRDALHKEFCFEYENQLCEILGI